MKQHQLGITTTHQSATSWAGWGGVLTLITAQFISMVGNNMTMVALPWFVLETTGSAGKMGLVAAAQGLGWAGLGLFAGTLADRVNRKWLMVTADLLRFVLIALVPALHMAGLLRFWMLPLIGLISQTIAAPYVASRMALVPNLVGNDKATLTRANAGLQSSFCIASILGPALAGAVIGWVGLVNVFYLDALSFLMSAILIATTLPNPGRRNTEPSSHNLLAETWDGVRFLWSNKLFSRVTSFGIYLYLLFVAIEVIALPVYIKDVMHESVQALAWAMIAWAGGNLIGAWIYSTIVRRWPMGPWATLSTMSAVMIFPLVVLPFYPHLWVTLSVFFVSGLGLGPLYTFIPTLLQYHTPDEKRGRVFAAFNALLEVAVPAGAATSGQLIEQLGLLPVMTAMIGMLVLGWVGFTTMARLTSS